MEKAVRWFVSSAVVLFIAVFIAVVVFVRGV